MKMVDTAGGTVASSTVYTNHEYPAGVWFAYHYDFSEMVPFMKEIEALRYAVTNSMQVIYVATGVGLREAVHAHVSGKDVPK